MKNKWTTVTAGALITCLVLMWVFHGHFPLPDATEVGPVREATHQQPIPAKSATTPDHEDVYKPATESTTHATWPGSSILESVEEEPDPTGTFTRITVVQPRQLPYPVRIEERIRINPQGEEVVEERFEVVADQVLARPLYGKEAEFLNLVQAEGLGTERLSQTGIYRIHLANSGAYAVPTALGLLGQWNNLLAYCETDDIVRPTAIPDDPAYGDGSLWGMHNTGQNEGVPDADIDAPEGWDIRTDASSIIVGVIDSGVRYTHEDIAANMWVNSGEDGLDSFGNSKRTNGIDDDANGYVDDVHGINAIEKTGDPMDRNGHGSHVAGTIAGVANNGKGVTGVAWTARIMALRFIDGGGATSDAIICFEYAMEHGVRVTNNSWGGPRYSQALMDTLEAAGDTGLLVVAAAGNDSQDNDGFNQFPANYELSNVLAVAATDQNDDLAYFSNYGSGTVEIAAPGVDIYSLSIDSNNSYANASGTSMASPMVSGVAALVTAEFPDSDPFAIKNRLLQSVRQVPSLVGKTSTSGIVTLPTALSTTSDAPYNDQFSKAALIPSDPSVIKGTTYHATTETGEPPHAGANLNSIWYKWQAQNSGTTLASTYGSALDTVIAVYTGTSPANLVEISNNDDFEGNQWSRVQWESQTGQTYYIAVCGKGNADGFVRVTFSGPPVEDQLADAIMVPSFPFTYSSDNTNASREEGEPLHAGATGGGSLWVKLLLTDSSRNIVITTRNSDFDTLLAVYGADVANPGFGELQLVASNDDGPYGDTFSEVSFRAVQNRTYWIVTDGKNSDRGIVRMRGFSKVINDDFINPIGLTGDVASYELPQSTMTNATREPGEPNHANADGRNSLWWFWSPDTAGDYVLQVDGYAALDTYVGNSLSTLVSVARERKESGAITTVKIKNAQPDIIYSIALDSRGDAFIPNALNLSINPSIEVQNDNWKLAPALSGNPGIENPLTVSGTTLGASIEGGEPGSSMVGSVWYTWTAPVSGEFVADTHYSNALAKLNIYETDGNPTWFNEFVLVGSGDQNGVGVDAWVRFTAVEGKTYYFQVSSPTIEKSGEFFLNLRPFQRPLNDDLANAEVLTGFFAQREYQNFGATRETGEPLHATDNTYHNGIEVSTELPKANKTLWFKWTADESTARRTSASSFGSNTVSIVGVYEGPAVGATYENLTPLAGSSSHWYTWWAWGEFNWNAEAGKTYYIMLGMSLSAKEEIQRFSLWQNPNDNFADREILSGNNVSTATANFAATAELGEPAHITGIPGGRSLWYEWTAPDTGTYIVDTIHSYLTNRFSAGLEQEEIKDSGVRMHLAVYTGSKISTLTKVGSNSAISMRNYDAMVTLNATAGTTYLIAVDTKVGPSADIVGPKTEWAYRAIINLNITKGSLPNDNLADAKAIEGDTCQEFIDLKFATREPNEPIHGDRYSRSAWWKWTAQELGVYYLATSSDIFDSEDNRTPGIAVYSGPAVNPDFSSLSKEAEANNSGYSTSYIPAQTSIYAIPGTTYYIAVDLNSSGTGSHKGFKTGLLLSPPPANDNLEGAIEITGSRRTVHGHNVGATEQPGEPDIDPSWKKTGSTNSSVWWKWTAPASGPTRVDTKDSYIYGELGVYTGSEIGQLFEIAREETDGSFDNGYSYLERADLGDREVVFNAEAGTTYYIMVNGSSWEKESRGPITLTVTGQAGKPLSPSGLTATRMNASRVELQWTDEAVDESTYVIQRAASWNGPWQEVYTSGQADTASWTDLNASGALYYRVRAEGSGGIGDWANTFVGSAKNMTALETWREEHFGTADNSGDAADSADPDADGLSNKLEFALRTNPLLTDSEATAPTGHLVSEDDSLYLHYSYRRRAGDGSGSTLTGYTIDGITYSLKTATPLDSTTWFSGPGFFEEPSPPVDNGDGTETVTVKVLQPAGVDGPFVRLLIE